MRKTNDTFMPSAVLDAIYDILSESICVAGNEDIYFDDITWDIIRLLNEHNDVTTFLWEDVRNEDDTGGMFFISWTEGKRLFHEHYKYEDYDEDLGHGPGKRNVKERKHG